MHPKQEETEVGRGPSTLDWEWPKQRPVYRPVQADTLPEGFKKSLQSKIKANEGLISGL